MFKLSLRQQPKKIFKPQSTHLFSNDNRTRSGKNIRQENVKFRKLKTQIIWPHKAVVVLAKLPMANSSYPDLLKVIA